MAPIGRPVVQRITIRGRTVKISSPQSPANGADVWLIRYDSRTIEVPILRGENADKTLPHKNIVRGAKIETRAGSA